MVKLTDTELLFLLSLKEDDMIFASLVVKKFHPQLFPCLNEVGTNNKSGIDFTEASSRIMIRPGLPNSRYNTVFLM